MSALTEFTVTVRTNPETFQGEVISAWDADTFQTPPTPPEPMLTFRVTRRSPGLDIGDHYAVPLGSIARMEAVR